MMDTKVLFGAIVGALATIGLNVLANLITPDRERLIDRVRNWWASQSEKRAKKRIQELEAELKMLSDYAENPQLLSLYFWQTVFGTLVLLCMAGALFLAAELLSPISSALQVGVIGGIVIFIAVIYRSCNKAETLSRQIRSYEVSTERMRQQIAKFQERIGGFSDDLNGVEDRATDLQEVMYDATCQKLEPGPSRIFHAQCPYVLPVCFKHPERSEYTYIVIGATADDEKDRIVTEPSTACSSVLIRQVHWYKLTSDRSIKSIRFGDRPGIEDFRVVEAEIHPIGTWNKQSPVTVPADRSRTYGLAITEQHGLSTWFVSIDDRQYTFNENLGCHFVEFILPKGQQHNLSFGYKDGPFGVACAFFAF